jgi:aspartyl-tRNA(Asn)/glutamyl-tRNA(Gln) amidotransferase subunit C
MVQFRLAKALISSTPILFPETTFSATLSSMITTAELEHLAKLARIDLSEDDKRSLIKEFDSILGYIDQLKKADVKMDAEGRVGAVKNVTRPDEAVKTSAEDRERLLDEAPDREEDFIAVKKIIAQD